LAEDARNTIGPVEIKFPLTHQSQGAHGGYKGAVHAQAGHSTEAEDIINATGWAQTGIPRRLRVDGAQK